MPEQRGKQATEDVKAEWTRAYEIYLRAPGDRYDKKKDRTARIDTVAHEMRLTRNRQSVAYETLRPGNETSRRV